MSAGAQSKRLSNIQLAAGYPGNGCLFTIHSFASGRVTNDVVLGSLSGKSPSHVKELLCIVTGRWNSKSNVPIEKYTS